MRGAWVGVLALLFGQGCSSSYEPARSPRIVTVVEGGQPTFVKDGERIGNTTFGTGLVEAVEGNPEAEHHATVGRNLMLGGFVLDLAGLGAAIGGMVVVVQDAGHDSNDHSSAASALLIGGAIAAVAGSVMILCGQPHLYDAVNIYNDGLDSPSKPAPLGPRAHYAPRHSSH